MKRFFAAICLLACLFSARGQKLIYDVDFLFDFDNRECRDTYATDGTLFGIRLTPTVGMLLNDSLDGEHRLVAGLSYVQPFGADWRYARVSPEVFYRYDLHGLRMHLGFIPYAETVEALPDYLMSDSLAFAYPHIQGMLVQYRSRWGYAEAFCDWRGMMTDTVREAFRLVGDGQFRYKWFNLGGYAQLNHLSHSERVLGVIDDVMVNPYMGLDFSSLTPLDSLALRAGYLMSWQRDRRAATQFVSHGLHLDLHLRWRFIGLRSELYAGANPMPFYGRYGSVLNQGAPYYCTTLMSRTDFYLYMLRLPFVTAYAGWNVLYMADYGLSHQQQVVCRFSVEEAIRFSRLPKEEQRDAWRRGRMLRCLTYR